MNRFAKMKKERIYTLFETLSWMMIVYLSDMCLKKWKQKRVPNIYSKLFFLAVWTGLEPATPCVTGMYSNQLNYQTKMFSKKAVRTGLEPATPCVTGMYSNQLNYRTFFASSNRCYSQMRCKDR